MTKKYLHYYLAVAILVIAQFIALDACALETGTIVTKDEQRYENVTFDILPVYKVISFDYEGEKKNLSFDRIDVIYGPDGSDITAAVIGGHYKPKKEEWKSETDTDFGADTKTSEDWNYGTDPDFKRARAAKYSVGLRLGGSYSIPISDYYDGITSGIGIEGELLIGLTHNMGIRVLISKSGMDVEDNFRLFYSVPEATILSEEYKYTMIRYMLGVQYYEIKGQIDRSKTMLYIYTGLGLITEDITATVTVRDNLDDQIYVLDGSASESRFALNFGAGLTTFISKNVGVDFAFSMDQVFIPGEGNYKSTTAYSLDLKAGLVLLLD